MTTAENGGVIVAPGLSTPGVPEAVVAASPDALVGVDAAGTAVLTNPAVETLFGYAPADLLGQPVELLLPAVLGSTHVAHRHAYGAHPPPPASGGGSARATSGWPGSGGGRPPSSCPSGAPPPWSGEPSPVWRRRPR